MPDTEDHQMSQDRDSSNPLKDLFDRIKGAGKRGGGPLTSGKPRSGGMRNEAEQREADAEFERKKAQTEERRAAADSYLEKLERKAERGLRAERAEKAGLTS
jgi:hypothetical protein